MTSSAVFDGAMAGIGAEALSPGFVRAVVATSDALSGCMRDVLQLPLRGVRKSIVLSVYVVNQSAFDDRVNSTADEGESPLVREIAMNLQPFRGVAVNLKPLPYQCGLDLRQSGIASPHPTSLPEWRREYAQWQQPHATTLQPERNVDMCSVDVVSVASENIDQLVASGRVEQAEQADPQCAKPATGNTQTGCSRLVASRQDQVDFHWQLGLDRLQFPQDSRLHAHVSCGPARPDLYAGLNATRQRKQIRMHREDIRERGGQQARL
ncbi:hypothetical protein [Burkholderia arboris]|uniref:hypothetical protein n=1 Tax=Burkholderia arboris TaxID=488730 RepID=UPI0015888C99|nr:hypothetical protein [Burkholderia arboris]